MMKDGRYLKREKFSPVTYALLAAALFVTFVVCLFIGRADISFRETVTILWNEIRGLPAASGNHRNIIWGVRMPGVLCVMLVGASLSLCGAAMQGLLRNPLADGSIMGVSSGAALGAVIAMATGFTLPGFGFGGVTVMAMAFAFGSLLLILGIAYALDRSLSTNSIILIGVIFSMFISSLISIIVTFASRHTQSLSFWTLGSFSGANYQHALLLLAALAICGGVILRFAPELNAFAVGEDNARHIGVNVKRVKLMILFAVSALIGVCVSVAGIISFVGLVMPHIARMLVGPNHKRLLPASLFSGAIFLLLADLLSRRLLPVKLPIGVVTSIVGGVAFIIIFYRTGKARLKRCCKGIILRCVMAILPRWTICLFLCGKANG